MPYELGMQGCPSKSFLGKIKIVYSQKHLISYAYLTKYGYKLDKNWKYKKVKYWKCGTSTSDNRCYERELNPVH